MKTEEKTCRTLLQQNLGAPKLSHLSPSFCKKHPAFTHQCDLVLIKSVYSMAHLYQEFIPVHILSRHCQQEIYTSILLEKYAVVDAAFCLNHFPFFIVNQQRSTPLVASESNYLTPSSHDR